MIVRRATPEDAVAIAALVNPVIRDTAITFTTAEKDPEELSHTIAAANGAFHVAEDRGQIVGYATYFQFRGGPGYAHTMEHSIALAPEARGKGAGRSLMTAIERHAKAAGAHSLIAGVSAENPAGIAFHAALGFDEVARLPEVGRKFGRWMDLVLLQKFP